jgi:hypothetical protein
MFDELFLRGFMREFLIGRGLGRITDKTQQETLLGFVSRILGA